MNEHFPKTMMVSASDNGYYECYDYEQFTHKDTDVRYEKVDGLVDTALRLLTEAGYDVEIKVTNEEEHG